MKKILTAAATLLFMSAGAYAQNCKLVKEKKDAFSDKSEKTAQVVTGKVSLMGGIKWLWEFHQADGATSIKLSIAMMGEFNQPFEQGTRLLLKLENGKVLTLTTVNNANPVTQALNGGSGTINVFTTYMLSFKPAKEDLTALSQSTITDLKVDIPDRTIVSPKVVKKQMEQIMNVSGCLLATHK